MENEIFESESQRPADETSKDSIRRSISANENDYRFHGIAVKFPHKPYRSQLMMMSRVGFTMKFTDLIVKEMAFLGNRCSEKKRKLFT